MYQYFAQFLPDEQNPLAYNVDFPDLPGCVTCGESLTQALQMAQDCLRGYLETSLREGEALPEPSDYLNAKAKAESQCQALDIPLTEGTFYQIVQVRIADEKPVRVNLSLYPSVVKAIDDAAEREGMTRSGFMSMTAKQYIQHANM